MDSSTGLSVFTLLLLLLVLLFVIPEGKLLFPFCRSYSIFNQRVGLDKKAYPWAEAHSLLGLSAKAKALAYLEAKTDI
ncbi:hypothetical protein [Granulicella rosea]|uniref:hypothetical protein n=1 Tax=Granulicella rosea TaxID=474952 RepID=UPI000B79874B|nr:hypothetical protein [Granulicella rosea]